MEYNQVVAFVVPCCKSICVLFAKHILSINAALKARAVVESGRSAFDSSLE
jgi:hypothetical protein